MAKMNGLLHSVHLTPFWEQASNPIWLHRPPCLSWIALKEARMVIYILPGVEGKLVKEEWGWDQAY